MFQFNGPVTQGGSVSAVDAASSAIGDLPSTQIQGNSVIVTLTNIPDAARVKVSLANVNGAGVNAQASVGFLVGDVNQSGRVSAADVIGVKVQTNLQASGATFRSDVKGEGLVDAKDVAMVKARAGRVLP